MCGTGPDLPFAAPIVNDGAANIADDFVQAILTLIMFYLVLAG